jgi:hypothetical protein
MFPYNHRDGEMTSQFDTLDAKTIDAETIKIVYEDVDFSSVENNSKIKDDVLGQGIQKAIELDKKLYKNRYELDKSDQNILPNVKMKKLDDRLYRGPSRSSSLIKDFDSHKIRSFKFASK